MTHSEICARLRDAGVENPSFEAALLLKHFCGAGRAEFGEADYQSRALEDAIKKRCARVPLQYVLGEWGFFHETYLVTPDCLIPRPDTEILVEEAIRLLPKNAYFADLCTGSGCIAVSTLCERPDTRALALEKFPKTLALAEENAKRNRVDDRFTPCLADLLTEKAGELLLRKGPFDAILSNPPYIPSKVIPTLAKEVRSEPLASLDGGEDGLTFYRALFKFSFALKPGGRMLLEIGYDQAERVTAMAKEAGFSEIRVIKDLGGNDRVVSLLWAGA